MLSPLIYFIFFLFGRNVNNTMFIICAVIKLIGKIS
jgi:hypothetical protein